MCDASNFKGQPEVLYIPESGNELLNAVSESAKKYKSITFFGAGTGLTGSAVACKGAVISLEKMNKIIEINEEEGYAHVEAGLTLNELEKELSVYNYFYPPNPTEKNSTIGGNIATNASGSRTFKYGPTRNFIIELNLILANGERINIKRGEHFKKNGILSLPTEKGRIINIDIPDIKIPEIKHAAGYYIKPGMDAIDLFIGSEGTLAVTSSAKIKILHKPQAVLGLIVFFENSGELFSFVKEISYKSRQAFTGKASDISARLIEYFDTNSLNLLREKYKNIPDKADSAIWIEEEYKTEDEDFILQNWIEHIGKHSPLSDETWTALDDKSHRLFTEFRHELPLKVNEKVSQNKQRKIATDTAVPDIHFEEHFHFVTDILYNSGIEHAVYGHIANSHLHANLFPVNHKEKEIAEGIYLKCIKNSLQFGGTVSAEHGIGKIKKKYFHMMFNEQELNEMKKIKAQLDPENYLGQGNLF